ncbi:DUF3857 domain-containing protein [Prevotella sp.]|uniref:DUF3857 domain-containing protein n=1 Tax=Prevotella sp. TaxID=59823 RepID=UPI0026489CBB|nr:DUF3857 domain-containing protein [Prevotella sp.]MDN5552807.1 DUF3857 domain-containing protein [Prevotella sp.]
MKNNISLYIIAGLLMISQFCNAQTNVIVLDDNTQVQVHDKLSATFKRHKMFKIINDKGADAANFNYSCSKDVRLGSFSGLVTDQAGHVLRKIKKGDLLTSEYSEEMASDAYRMYFEYTPPLYPITVTYDWTIEESNGFKSYPSFEPQSNYDVEVRHASYKLISPNDIPCRYQCINTNCKVNKTIVKNNTVIDVSIDSLNAIHKEAYSKPLYKIMPSILFAPVDFVYKGTSGSMASWHDLGLWLNGLAAGRDVLDDAAKTKIHELTDTCRDDKSKIELLYQLLEKSTRYVSIQLGIGGMQPMAACDVYRYGFGDCKGLSNFMHAMLKEVGIHSNYAIISMTYDRQQPTFSSLDLFNHAILQVPLKKDTLWLECTAPDLALGYVHADIAGHDALVITNEGGKLCRLPEYADTANIQHSDIDITLSADGMAVIKMVQRSSMRQYEDKLELVSADEIERKKYINDVMKVPDADISKMDVKLHKQSYSVPLIQIDACISSHGYANLTGSRLFVPLNPSHRGFTVPESTNVRKHDIYKSYGYIDEENITIHIPAGFTLEACPRDTICQSPFGKLAFSLAHKGNDIKVNYKLLMNKGLFSADKYSQLYDFMKLLASLYSQKIVLKKI